MSPSASLAPDVFGGQPPSEFQRSEWPGPIRVSEIRVVRPDQDQSFLSVYHQRRVAGLSMLYKVYSNSNHCLFSEILSASTSFYLLLSASFYLLLSDSTYRAVAAAHQFKF